MLDISVHLLLDILLLFLLHVGEKETAQFLSAAQKHLSGGQTLGPLQRIAVKGTTFLFN